MVFVISFLVFIVVSVLLSLGLIIAGKKIKGSCGGIAVIGPDGAPLSCDTCPNRNKNPNCENKKS